MSFVVGTTLLLWRNCPTRRVEHLGALNTLGYNGAADLDETHLFSRRDVLNRLKAHSPNHYSGLYNVMKGVTLAAVGLSLIALLSHSVPPERTALLLVALLSVFISYNGEAIGQTIIHLYPATIDVFLPMALTVSLLLVVGLPGADEKLGAMPTQWFIAFATWNLIAAALVASVASRLRLPFYESYLHSTVNKYRSRMFIDAICASGVGVSTLIFLLFRHSYLPKASAWEYAFLAVVSVFLLSGLIHHEATRKELKQDLLLIADQS